MKTKKKIIKTPSEQFTEDINNIMSKLVSDVEYISTMAMNNFYLLSSIYNVLVKNNIITEKDVDDEYKKIITTISDKFKKAKYNDFSYLESEDVSISWINLKYYGLENFAV